METHLCRRRKEQWQQLWRLCREASRVGAGGLQGLEMVRPQEEVVFEGQVGWGRCYGVCGFRLVDRSVSVDVDVNLREQRIGYVAAVDLIAQRRRHYDR